MSRRLLLILPMLIRIYRNSRRRRLISSILILFMLAIDTPSMSFLATPRRDARDAIYCCCATTYNIECHTVITMLPPCVAAITVIPADAAATLILRYVCSFSLMLPFADIYDMLLHTLRYERGAPRYA